MDKILQSNNLMKTVVAVVLTVLMIGVMMIPVINALGEDKEVTTTVTLSNRGSPFALANADSESHPIIMSVDGDQLIVTSDGTPVSTGLGTVLPSYIGVTNTGPFNTYYVAVNLSNGDNADDSGETRLSKVKGEIAYYLDANDWTKTINGYTYNMSLYNIMMVIPPVYWYSELDSGSTDTGKLYISSSPDAFVSMGISADQLKDYAHTYTDNGVVGHAPAIMIGAYSSVIENSEIVSHPRGTLNINQLNKTYPVWQSAIESVNPTVSYGTYQLWNAYQWTLYKIMAYTINGSMDSKLCIGSGLPGNWESNTAYSKEITENNTTGNSLLIENPWARQIWLGDTMTSNGTIIAGNQLGGVTDLFNTVNTLSANYALPLSASSSSEWITKITPNSELFGLPVEVSTTKANISEKAYFVMSGDRVMGVGGSSLVNSEDTGIGTVFGNAGATISQFTARMIYVVTDESYTPPVGANMPYAYVVSYNTNGTVSDVQSIENGESNSYMPIYDSESATYSFNPYWDFERKIDIPQLSDATDSVDLAVGSDSILQFYNSGNVVLQTATGTVDLGRVNDVTPVPVTVTVQNGVMTYTGGSANISLYRSDSGTYVYATNNINVLNDAEIYVAQYQYGVETSNGTKDMGMIGSGTSETLSANVSLFNTPNVDTETVNADITINENSSKINSLSVDTVFTDSDTVDYGAIGFYVPKTASYDLTTIERGGGMAYDLLLYMPILVVLALIVLIAGSWYYNRTY